jgi:MFS family permease
MTSTAAERRVEVRPPESERPRYGLLAGLALGLLPAELDQSIFATALPAVVAELGGLAGLALINASYVLAGAVAMLLVGPLGDRFGRRPVFVWATVAFLAGSVLGGVAPTLPVLVAARVVQGLGGGGLLVLIQAIVADLVAPRRRAWYLAVVDATYAVAAVSGPVLGGWLTEYASWRWAFWLNLPVGVLALLAVMRWLPASRPLHSGSRVASRLRPLGLLRCRAVGLPVAGGALLAVAVFGAVNYLPTFLQLAAGQSPVHAGLTMLSLVAGLGLATVAAAHWLRRTGRAYGPPVIGALLVTLALGLCATLTPDSPLPAMIIYLFLLGAGTGLAWEVLIVVVQEAAPADQLGSATAVNGFCREVGVLVGTAAVGGLLVQRLAGVGLEPMAYADALTPLLAGLVPVTLLAAGLLAAVRPVQLRVGHR